MAADSNVDRDRERTVIPAVVLAAGKSSRMGRLKAVLPLGPDDTFITRIIRTLDDARVDDVAVVVGHEAAAVVEAISNAGWHPRIVLNEQYESGQLSSVLAGLRAIDRPGVQGMLLTLVDVPLVSAQTVREVIERHRSAAPPVVRPVNGDRHGHPILIDRTLFPLLRSADPAQGIKPIVRAHVSAAGEVAVSDDGAFLDIDTPDEYARVMRG